ncbi:hypothetical protein ACE4RR_13070 [Alteribacillus sp. HJP-4]
MEKRSEAWKREKYRGYDLLIRGKTIGHGENAASITGKVPRTA